MSRSTGNVARSARRERLAALEHQRRSMIAALVQIDAAIARARMMPHVVPFDDDDEAAADVADVGSLEIC